MNIISGNHVEAESEYVTMLEQWRKNLDINKMHLMGHRFLKNISTVYITFF